jgi:hypothetical protein
MKVENIGYGAGGRNPAEMPNVLCPIMGNMESDVEAAESHREHTQHHHTHHHHVH